jgi:hypothetical protein
VKGLVVAGEVVYNFILFYFMNGTDLCCLSILNGRRVRCPGSNCMFKPTESTEFWQIRLNL